MKKLVLGLLLTVGVSGVSFANQNEIQKNKDRSTNQVVIEEQKIDNKKITTIIEYRYVNGKIADCTISNVTYVYDTCGNLTDIWKDTYSASGSVCSGTEGGVIFNAKRMMSGFGDCPAG